MRYPSAEKSHSFPGYLLLKYSLTESTVLELWQDGQAVRNGGGIVRRMSWITSDDLVKLFPACTLHALL